MGCTGSKPDELEYIRQIEELRLQLKDLREKSHEEENLLRFKIEVLVNMLTVEEQRSEIATKRLETLKWVVSTSGDLESVRHLIHSTNESEIFNKIEPLNAELGEAIEIMRKDFAQFREDIFLALATEDGHIVSSLPRIEFLKQVYGATENVQKSELQLIAARFDDGNGSVNVPEFLDFFCTPHTLRTAKSAANAVRMSLDMLALNENVYTNIQPDNVEDVETRRSHFTNRLDRSGKKILALWLFVREELLGSFSVLKETRGGSGKNNLKSKTSLRTDDVVKVSIFERSLMEICGKNAFFMLRLSSNTPLCEELYSKALKTIKKKYSGKSDADDADKENHKEKENKVATDAAKKPADASDDESEVTDETDSTEVPSLPLDRLDVEDAVMLARRFELAGYVHLDGFFSFFDEAFLRTQAFTVRGLPVQYDAAITGISPFRGSTEWTDLKQTSILRQSQQNLPPPPKKAEPPAIVPAKAPEPAPVVEKPEVPVKPKEIPKEEPKPVVVPPPAAEPKVVAPPAIEEKKVEEKKPTAPVAATGCGCFGSKPKTTVATAEEKKRPTDPPTPMPRHDSKHLDDKPAAKDEDKRTREDAKRPDSPVLEEKKVRDEPLPVLKPSEEFETPPKKILTNRNAGFLPDRDGLGHEDDQRRARLNAELGGVPTPIGNNSAPAAGARRRLRRHEDRDFAHEKNTNPLDEDNDDELDGGAVRFNAPRSRGNR